MSARNFSGSLLAVLRHEGGKVDDPNDPGGRTAYGVTQAVYDAWRRQQGLAPRDVWSITPSEISAIYRKQYWDAVRGDDLPSGVDYAVFDFAVNSGPARAIKFLQREVGAAPDGKLGPATLAAVNAADPRRIVAGLSAARQAYLETLNTFPRFGKGWTTRVADVAVAARGMCA